MEEDYLSQLIQDQTQIPGQSPLYANNSNTLSKRSLRRTHSSSKLLANQQKLQLKVLSSMTLEKGLLIEINSKGLVSQEPLRKAYDGVTYFGC
jgi:hypothetical protein